MFSIGTINWKDAAQNLLIAIACFITGGYVGYKASRVTSIGVINQLTPVIKEAIQKETTAIKNEILLKDFKIKKSDSLNININQKPQSKIEQIKVNEVDTIKTKKVSWWKRNFGKKR